MQLENPNLAAILPRIAGWPNLADLADREARQRLANNASRRYPATIAAVIR
jgi:hypothetical protein